MEIVEIYGNRKEPLEFLFVGDERFVGRFKDCTIFSRYYVCFIFSFVINRMICLEIIIENLLFLL